MSRISKMDWDTIDKRVSATQKRRLYPNKSMAFLSIVMEQKFSDIEEHLPELITDGGEDRGVDGIYISEGEEVADVFIFQSKYREKFEKSHNTINEVDVLKIDRFLKELFDKSATLAKCGNFHLLENVKRIWALHENGMKCDYQVIFCSNDKGFSSTTKNLIETSFHDFRDVTFDFYGVAEIISAISLERRKPEDGQLRVIDKEILERTDGDVRGVIISVYADSFIKLIAKEDGSDIKGHLFDDNLRIFLGEKGGYNRSIIDTAASSDSYLFWYLNNGVTITCKNFWYNKGHVNPVLKFKEFQIVNGAQTSHSLFEAERRDPDAFKNVVLMVRIYATDRSDIAERVAVATNSQARIQTRDLRSNEPILKKLESALKEHDYFFERKRNMHIEQLQEKRIDALKLGQVILAFYLQEPDKARTESDAIFGGRFEQIFHDEYDVDNLIRVFKLFQIIERLRESYQIERTRSSRSNYEYRYLVYGYWFVLFTCRLFLANEETVPEGDEAEKLVTKAIRLVASIDNSQRPVAHYLMFRSSETKERIKDAILDQKNNEQLDLLDQLDEH